MRNALCLTLAAIAVSSCVSVPVTHFCDIAGDLNVGANCANTRGPETFELTLNETMEMLLPQEERFCVPVPGMSICKDDQTADGVAVKLPARAGAIIQSAEDWGKMKTALELACRALGRRCTYEVQSAIEGMKNQ